MVERSSIYTEGSGFNPREREAVETAAVDILNMLFGALEITPNSASSQTASICKERMRQGRVIVYVYCTKNPKETGPFLALVQPSPDENTHILALAIPVQNPTDPETLKRNLRTEFDTEKLREVLINLLKARHTGAAHPSEATTNITAQEFREKRIALGNTPCNLIRVNLPKRRQQPY